MDNPKRDMKTLGLIGGMSWKSTAHYYSRINQLVAERLGGLHSAQLFLFSVEFYQLQKPQHTDDWAGAACLLMGVATRLERTASTRSISSHRIRSAGR